MRGVSLESIPKLIGRIRLVKMSLLSPTIRWSRECQAIQAWLANALQPLHVRLCRAVLFSCRCLLSSRSQTDQMMRRRMLTDRRILQKRCG